LQEQKNNSMSLQVIWNSEFYYVS